MVFRVFSLIIPHLVHGWRQDIDNYTPVGRVMRAAHNILAYYERLPRLFPTAVGSLRDRGLAFALDYIQAEDKQTNHICIGPVSKAMHRLCAWLSAGGDNPNEPNAASAARSDLSFRRHVARVGDYLWVAEVREKRSLTMQVPYKTRSFAKIGLGQT